MTLFQEKSLDDDGKLKDYSLLIDQLSAVNVFRKMVPILFLCLFLGANAYLELVTPAHKQAFDPNLFEEVLDEELCHEQMTYLINNDTELLLRFLDAGFRTPRGFFDGNLADLGNYHQCLALNQEAPSISSRIEGKYCTINLPLAQDIKLPSLPEWPEWPDLPWPEIPWPDLNPNTTRFHGDVLDKLVLYEKIKRSSQVMLGGGAVNRFASDSPFAAITLLLAICIPKSCTTEQAITELLFNTTEIGLKYEDNYCRLPNDKQWVAADYVAIVIFSFLGLLLIASTGYDVYQTVILNRDPKRVNKIYQSFSVYTNTRRLVTYTPVPGAIECLDGVRSFAMMWVIIGHTYVNQVSDLLANPLDVLDWIMSPQAIWVTMGPITVDTFFMLSGLLLVYTTAGKLTRSKLLKNLHMFYLNRLLRMFPLLAAFVLIHASILNRMSDGPNWNIVALNTHRCRVYWWSTLLHVQNWVNPSDMCLAHSWYLAIDVQLYIISPLVLFWVLGKRKVVAWIALTASLMLSLVGASVYNFIMEFQAGPVIPSRDDESQGFYITKYYVNTLTRSSPFFVGMIYGYILHLNRNVKFRLPMVQAGTLWACAILLLAAITWITYPIMQTDWDNQIVDSLINSYMRPCWALAVGWIIFACHHGYGGPINWVLSLQCFKVLGRLSYAMYIVHYPLIFMVNSSKIAPGYFSVTASLFKFLADFSLAAIVAYILTMLVDSPCSTLIKFFLGGGPRKPRPAPAKDLIEQNGSSGIVNQAYINDENKNSSL